MGWTGNTWYGGGLADNNDHGRGLAGKRHYGGGRAANGGKRKAVHDTDGDEIVVVTKRGRRPRCLARSPTLRTKARWSDGRRHRLATMSLVVVGLNTEYGVGWAGNNERDGYG